MAPGFDDRLWQNATVHPASGVRPKDGDVRPKDGYDDIAWNPAAEIIRGPDLERDNIVLCRLTVNN